jgi:hypothetical protein
MPCHAQHVDPARGDFDHEQRLRAFAEHRVHGEAAHRQDALGRRPQELSPCDRRALGRWSNAGAWEDGPHGAGPILGPRRHSSRGCGGSPGSGSPWPAAAPAHGPLTSYPAGHARAGSSSGAAAALGASAAAWPARRTGRASLSVVAAARAGQHRAVGPVDRRPGHLPPQHHDLVAQQWRLSVLRGRTPRQQYKPLNGWQNIRHSSRRVMYRSSRLGDSSGELAAQAARPTFLAPTRRGPGRPRRWCTAPRPR